MLPMPPHRSPALYTSPAAPFSQGLLASSGPCSGALPPNPTDLVGSCLSCTRLEVMSALKSHGYLGEGCWYSPQLWVFLVEVSALASCPVPDFQHFDDNVIALPAPFPQLQGNRWRQSLREGHTVSEHLPAPCAGLWGQQSPEDREVHSDMERLQQREPHARMWKPTRPLCPSSALHSQQREQ